MTVRLRVELPPQAYPEACRTLRSLLGPIRAQPGCSATRLLRDLDGERSLTFVEEWRERVDFEGHLHSSAFRKLVAVLEQGVAAPEVEIDEISSRLGVELVERILTGDDREGTEHPEQ
jgi:quinol monooxygenase YgiN